jgi:hypothetical protein
MKLTVSRLFEAGAVLEAFQKAKIEGIEGFVTFLSDFSENVIRGLRGQLTFRDNMLYAEKVISLKTGVAQRLAVPQSSNLPPRLVFLGKVTPYSAVVTGFQWTNTLDGQLEVVCTFSPVPTANSGQVEVTLCIFF